MAAPLKELDKDAIVQMAANGFTNEEIAAHLDCSADLIEMRYSGAIKKGRLLGNGTIRSRQFRLAAGIEAQPAEYLKDKNGEYVRDPKGNLVQTKPYVPAKDPNVAMLIWLGKQKLKQREPGFGDPTDGGDRGAKPIRGFTFTAKPPALDVTPVDQPAVSLPPVETKE